MQSYIDSLTKGLSRGTLNKQISNIKEFFKKTKHNREYTAKDVALLRSQFLTDPNWTAMAGSYKMRQKLNDMPLKNKSCFRALGALNPTQARAMMEAHIESDAPALDGIYLSGWQEASSGENTYGNMFPDQSLYPVNSVPEKIKKINQVLQAADRIKQSQLNNKSTSKDMIKTLESIDYQSPIIADIEAGFGQEIHTFQLAFECIKAGAACLHLEDQDGSLKKCGHMGGKVKVSIQQYITKLKAVRLAADVLGVDTVIIARTDARGTKLINNISDARDRQFCIKVITKAYLLSPSAAEVDLNTPAIWKKLVASLLIETYNCNGQNHHRLTQKCEQIVLTSMQNEVSFKKSIQSIKKATNVSVEQAKELLHIFNKCEYLSTADGYYRFDAGLQAAIEVGLAAAEYSDLIWFETSDPDIDEAKAFAKAIHAKYPKKAFHYNCSPSFNWAKHFKTKYGKDWKTKLENFSTDLAKLGFKSQKITLFGMHAVNQGIKDRVIAYQKRHMKGYSELQEDERKSGNRSFEHQSFVGVDVWSSITECCAGEGSELVATFGDSATMDQFH